MKFRRTALHASLLLPLACSMSLGGLGSAGAAPRPLSRAAGSAARPRLLLGPLTAAAGAATPAEAASAALAQLRGRAGLIPQELSAPEAAPAGLGHIVRYQQRHRGLPVFGGEIALRLDEAGRAVRLVRDVLDEDRLASVDTTPRLSAEAARRAVAGLARGATAPAPAGAPTLEIDLESGRLVWVVTSVDLRRLENALYLVDAASGEVLRRIDRLRFADRFRVYRPNPAVNAAPESADVPGGAAGPFATDPMAPRALTSALLRGTNCLDDATTRDVPGLGSAVHLCAAKQTALGDAGGNYDTLAPLVDRADGVCPTIKDANQNQFAEAHMYWHAAAAYDHFRALFAGLGRSDFKLKVSTGQDPQPLTMVVNLCLPDFSNPSDTTRRLQPLENAFFSPGGVGGLNQILTGQNTDSLGFGMGRKANFALDGDVIYHEFTHAVVFSRGRLPLSIMEDDYGPSTDPGAMNEGLADYFSSTITGDPDVGEYAWRNFSDAGGGLRSLTNDDRCADQRVGEIHEDSKAFSGALWGARGTVAGAPGDASAAGRRDLFDQAVLAALDGSGTRPTMTDMAKLVLQEVEMRAGKLGADAREKAEAAFTAHGVLPECDRVIRTLDKKPMLCLDGTETRSGRKLIAGYVQWRVEVPATVDSLKVALRTSDGSCSSSGLGADPPDAKLQLAVRAADEPITWQRDEGTQDQLVNLKRSASTWTAQLPVKKGVYHVMLVNAGGSAIGQDITFTTSCQAPEGCKAEEPPAANPPMAGGCGCRVGGERDGRGAAAGLGAALGLLGLLGIGGLRRRRRGA